MAVVNGVRRGGTARRRRYLLWGCLVVAVLAALLAGPISNWYAGRPHGDPDPGGKRLAAITKVAHEVLPAGASAAHFTARKSVWGRGGCDGGPPGWANMEVDATFRAFRDVVPDVDARMRELGWRVLKPAPRPYVRRYGSSSIPGEPVAWLFTPKELHRPFWEIDLEAPPAEVADHAC